MLPAKKEHWDLVDVERCRRPDTLIVQAQLAIL